ncbi:hypothetical protein DSECCO2_245890 [anaerobic digester metagenome]
MKLTPEDIAALRYERRFGYLFPALLLALAVLLNALNFVIKFVPDVRVVIFANAAVLLLCLLIHFKISHKLNQDLRDGIKVWEKAKVQAKESNVSYEAGSGAMHIPVLGNLFPKLWGQEMRDSSCFYLILNSTRYEVSRELYEEVNVGDEVRIYYAQHSHSRLGIEKSNYPFTEM